MLRKPYPRQRAAGFIMMAHHAEPDHARARSPLEYCLALHQTIGRHAPSRLRLSLCARMSVVDLMSDGTVEPAPGARIQARLPSHQYYPPHCGKGDPMSLRTLMQSGPVKANPS